MATVVKIIKCRRNNWCVLKIVVILIDWHIYIYIYAYIIWYIYIYIYISLCGCYSYQDTVVSRHMYPEVRFRAQICIFFLPTYAHRRSVYPCESSTHCRLTIGVLSEWRNSSVSFALVTRCDRGSNAFFVWIWKAMNWHANLMKFSKYVVFPSE